MILIHPKHVLVILFIYLSIYQFVGLSLSFYVSNPTVHPSINPAIHLCPVAPILEHRTSVKCFASLQFLNLRQSVGFLKWGIRLMQRCYIHRTTQTQNKCRRTSMPWVEFEPTILAFEWVKTFHASDCTATVIGKYTYGPSQICKQFNTSHTKNHTETAELNLSDKYLYNWHNILLLRDMLIGLCAYKEKPLYSDPDIIWLHRQAPKRRAWNNNIQHSMVCCNQLN
jgi:hypothetical protein